MTSPVDPTELPQSVYDLMEFSSTEDVILAILRGGLPEVPVYSLIPEDTPPYFVLVRRYPGLGVWSGDERFIDQGRFVIHCFTEDPEGDYKGAVLSEAVRVVLRNAAKVKWHSRELGSVVDITMTAEPTRKTDWATASGPVQYADLPTRVWRYESMYEITVRKPRK